MMSHKNVEHEYLSYKDVKKGYYYLKPDTKEYALRIFRIERVDENEAFYVHIGTNKPAGHILFNKHFTGIILKDGLVEKLLDPEKAIIDSALQHQLLFNTKHKDKKV